MAKIYEILECSERSLKRWMKDLIKIKGSREHR